MLQKHIGMLKFQLTKALKYPKNLLTAVEHHNDTT